MPESVDYMFDSCAPAVPKPLLPRFFFVCEIEPQNRSESKDTRQKQDGHQADKKDLTGQIVQTLITLIKFSPPAVKYRKFATRHPSFTLLQLRENLPVKRDHNEVLEAVFNGGFGSSR